MEKRKCPYVSFAIAVLSILTIILLMVETVDMYVELSKWAHSGIDWLPMALMPMLYAPAILVGTISSCFCGIKTTILWMRVVSFVILAICVVFLLLFLTYLFRWRPLITWAVQAFTWFANLFV